MSLAGLEELRLRLRGLVIFLDKKKRTIVYTDFKDEVLGVREGEAVYIPKMTGVQYEKKVNDYLRHHLNHVVIHRLRTNQPLTELDLKGLETALVEIGEEDGETLLSDLLARSEGAVARPLRAQPGRPGPHGGPGGVRAVPERPQPRAAADPFRRDGDRPAHGARCDGCLRALRAALQQPARGRPGRTVRGQGERDQRRVPDPGIAGAADKGRCGLRAVGQDQGRPDMAPQAVGAGATLVRKPWKMSWGGYSGYFKDPEGHLGQSPYMPPYYDMDIAPYVC
jgi:hypothetical protein